MFTKNEICIRCRKRAISNKSRKLCLPCYHYLYANKQLNEYPKQYNTFKNRLCQKYGEQLLLDLNLSIKTPKVTLASISRKYGFTLERARQIFVQLYGKNIYMPSRKRIKKNLDKKNRIKKGLVKTKKIVWNKLHALHFSPEYSLKRTPYTLIVNNLKIAIKGRRTSSKTSKKYQNYYYLAQFSQSEKETIDIVIIYIYPTEQFYIIPMKKIKGNIIYIRDTNKTKLKTVPKGKNNNWLSYLNAWEYLIPGNI